MMNHTIPYKRTMTISYYGQVATRSNGKQAIMQLSQYSLGLTLSPVNEFNNRRYAWVAATIANQLIGDPRTFRCIMEPVDNVFIVTSTSGDALRFKLYKNTLSLL